MIPLRDHNPSGRIPIVNYLLMAINVLVFIYMISLPENAIDNFINQYAVIPALIVHGKNLISLLTSMFLHGGFAHIIGNMIFLNIFGDNLEDVLGHFKYLLFYLFCGLTASGLQILVDPASPIPSLGASGAIAGIMGGYLVLFPRHKIDILFSFGFFLRTATVPAFFMLFYWFIFQLFAGVGSLGLSQVMGGVAYFAHIGGFASGYALISLIKNKLQKSNYFDIG